MIAPLLGVALAIAPVQADTTIDTVFVVSNRRRVEQGFTREVTDSLWYGIYVTRLVAGTDSPRALARMRVHRVDSAALDSDRWRLRLHTAVTDTSARHAALIFVHGYSSGPGVAVAQAIQVKARGGHAGPLVVFLWPTHDRYVAPPTPARAYKDDAAAAARSSGALARVLRTVDSLAPHAVLVAHSMGSRVALDAMIADTTTYAQLAASPLRAVGIFSPDIGADRFRSAFAPRLPAIAKRVVMYGASTDYLLGAAAIVNRERRASGITRRGAALAGIELVDDTRGARAEPVPLNVLGPRHAVRWAGAALTDFFGIVVSGAEPACRVSAGIADAEGEGRWSLRPRVILVDWRGAGCAPNP